MLKAVLTPYWTSFLKDVLWKTFRRAILYAVVLGAFSVLLSIFMVRTLFASIDGASAVKYLELGLLALVYVVGGVVCGFLAGVTSIRREVARLTDVHPGEAAGAHREVLVAIRPVDDPPALAAGAA